MPAGSSRSLDSSRASVATLLARADAAAASASAAPRCRRAGARSRRARSRSAARGRASGRSPRARPPDRPSRGRCRRIRSGSVRPTQPSSAIRSQSGFATPSGVAAILRTSSRGQFWSRNLRTSARSSSCSSVNPKFMPAPTASHGPDSRPSAGGLPPGLSTTLPAVARTPRLSGFDWKELARELDESGYARLPGLLDARRVRRAGGALRRGAPVPQAHRDGAAPLRRRRVPVLRVPAAAAGARAAQPARTRGSRRSRTRGARGWARASATRPRWRASSRAAASTPRRGRRRCCCTTGRAATTACTRISTGRSRSRSSSPACSRSRARTSRAASSCCSSSGRACSRAARRSRSSRARRSCFATRERPVPGPRGALTSADATWGERGALRGAHHARDHLPRRRVASARVTTS